MRWYRWRAYVPVATRRESALKKIQKLKKKGIDIQPVEITGRKIVGTFWGKAWCDHLESFGDYENRLPRGRSYVRNGLVCHLAIDKCLINAMVSGSNIYYVNISIRQLNRKKWDSIKERCSGHIGSVLELLQGRLSENVMTVVTDRSNGLFPLAGEINLKCSCPDWAVMCKHVAAVLYGVGARLDEQPELLFVLRGVDHEELISSGVSMAASAGKKKRSRRSISDEALEEVFGIEISEQPLPGGGVTPRRGKKTKGKKKYAVKNVNSENVSVNDVSTRPVTGKDVVELRSRFSMSREVFAKLLGVSMTSVAGWEGQSGPLNLRRKTHAAWVAVKDLTKRQARRKLKNL